MLLKKIRFTGTDFRERLHLIASYPATRDNTEIISLVRYELFSFDPVSRYETHWSAFAHHANPESVAALYVLALRHLRFHVQ